MSRCGVWPNLARRARPEVPAPPLCSSPFLAVPVPLDVPCLSYIPFVILLGVISILRYFIIAASFHSSALRNVCPSRRAELWILCGDVFARH